MADETPTNSSLLMDRGLPVGNSADNLGRRALHVKDVSQLIAGITFNAITATYPDAVTEQYQYRQGGKLGAIQATIEVVYSDATKANLVSVEKI